MENRFFFFFFCSRSLFIVCVWSLALRKGLQMLTREGLGQRPWHQVGEPSLRGGAGLAGLLCSGSISLPRRYQPGWPAEVGQVATTSRRWRFRKAQRWGIYVGRTQGMQIQSGLVQVLLQARGGIQCLFHLSGGGSGLREAGDAAAAAALALHLQRLPVQRMGGVGSGALQGHIMASNQSPQRGGCRRPAHQWLTTSSAGWNNSHGSGSASSWSAVRSSLQKWCWMVLGRLWSERSLEGGWKKGLLGPNCWSGDGTVGTPRGQYRVVLPYLILSSPTVF